jgi:hypothetical protein
VRAQRQRLRDLLLRLRVDEKLEDLALPIREAVMGPGAGEPGERAEHLPGDERVHRRPASQHRFDRRNDLVARAGLEQVAGRAGAEGLEDVVVILVDRQHDDLRDGRDRVDAADAFDAAHARQAEVHQHHVRHVAPL